MSYQKREQKRIYLDHASTTYLEPRVKAAMDLYWEKEFGNPSNLYLEGRKAKSALEVSRKTVASILGAKSEEILFTGSGTESDNLAIFGVARAYKEYGRHIISTAIEHHAVLHTLDQLKEEGFEITLLLVDKNGLIKIEDLQKALRPDTVLVSIGYANNEIGVIQPLSKIAEIIKKYKARKLEVGSWKLEINEETPFLHSDACQAAPYLNLNVHQLGIDLMTLNSSKVYGPKGVGCLYIKRGIKLEPMIYGGGQENSLRPGTENISGIVGFAKALEIAQKEKIQESRRLKLLQDKLINQIPEIIPKSVLNGHPNKRLPNNVNFSFLDIEGEALVLLLDNYGIACSTGSACTSESLEPSHVILALGKPYEFAHGSLRITLGKRNTQKDIDYFLKVLPKAVKKLREISPLNINAETEKMSHPEAFL